MRAALLALSLAFAAKPFPAPPRDYVHNEGVVSAAAEGELSAALADYERRSGHQFVVALFRSLEGEDAADYANKLFRHWKIGDAKRNDGLLFAVFLEDRAWRVDVGYGLEGVVTDLEAGEIAQRYALPLFRAGDFDGGVREAVRALMARVEGKAPPAPARPQPSSEPNEVKLFWALFFILMIAALIIERLPGSRRSHISSGGWGGGSYGGGGWSGGGGGFGGFSGGGGSSGGGGAGGRW